MTEDTTGRFAVLADRVERLGVDMHEHRAEDAKRFDKVESKIDSLAMKVAGLTTVAALIGSLIGHLIFGGH